MTSTTDTHSRRELTAGVIGVGNMGSHHARVYSELHDVTLGGVHDVDRERATAVAEDYGTQAMTADELLESVDIVSVAVPTEYHYDTVRACIDCGVHTLVEKPFVADLERGRDLARRADEAGVIIQVGHVERFNPAVRVLSDIVTDLDIVAVDIQRLGPPVERAITDSVVMDLMVHDIDLLLSLLDDDIDSLSAVARDDRHVTAQFGFENGSVGVLTASRLTQQKVRSLAITSMQCRVNVDFTSQSVEIHRRSLPEYVEADGDIRYRQESVVERPMVENGEPLKTELSEFARAARNGTEPLVTPADALRVLDVAQRIEELALAKPVGVSSQ